jgi:hypothetical protein
VFAAHPNSDLSCLFEASSTVFNVLRLCSCAIAGTKKTKVENPKNVSPLYLTSRSTIFIYAVRVLCCAVSQKKHTHILRTHCIGGRILATCLSMRVAVVACVAQTNVS